LANGQAITLGKSVPFIAWNMGVDGFDNLEFMGNRKQGGDMAMGKGANLDSRLAAQSFQQAVRFAEILKDDRSGFAIDSPGFDDVIILLTP
jgi:hypothetical protein